MADFVGSLRTSGQYSGWARGKEGAILDLEGNPVKGKKLSEFSFMTEWEKIDIEYTSRESTKEKLRREYEGVASDKLLDTIFRMIQFPYYGYNGDADRLKDAIEVIRKDYGVLFSESQLKKFIELYYSLNNHSNLWSNCGWTPDSLIKKEGRTRPSAITLGPNIRRMFETGELDLEEFKKAMRELGANLIE